MLRVFDVKMKNPHLLRTKKSQM